MMWTDFSKGGLAAGMAMAIVGFILWFGRYMLERRSAKQDKSESTAAEDRKRDRIEEATIAVAAMGFGKDIIAAYAQEVRSLRLELKLQSERHEAALTRMSQELARVQVSNSELQRLYYRAIDHIEHLETHIRKTDPNWPSHTLPRGLTSL